MSSISALVTEADMAEWVRARYADVIAKDSWGELGFFYNPGQALPNGVYFLTIKRKDSENDHASRLDRDQAIRINVGLERQDFEVRFGRLPVRPAKGGVIAGDWDFATRGELLPHPVYGWMGWACVVAPTHASLDRLAPLFDNAYRKAGRAFISRCRSASRTKGK